MNKADKKVKEYLERAEQVVEGLERIAGQKAREKMAKALRMVEYYKFYIGSVSSKNPADRRYKVYLKAEMDAFIDSYLKKQEGK